MLEMNLFFVSILCASFVCCELLISINLGRHGARRAGTKASYLKENDFVIDSLTAPGMR